MYGLDIHYMIMLFDSKTSQHQYYILDILKKLYCKIDQLDIANILGN